jgi:glycosyltransferase involved in cell wall biosynthesis
VRSYANMIAHLKEFEFFIITRNTDYGSNQAYKDIQPNSWVKLKDNTKVFYLSSDKQNKAMLKSIIQQTHFDVAMINGIYSWYFSILPLIILKKLDKPVIVSARGMLNPQAFSVKGFKKRLFLSVAKWFGLYKNIVFHATNPSESDFIKSILGHKTKVKIAPNLPRISNQKPETKSKHNPIRFVSIARIAREKGTLHVLKAFQNQKAAVELDLYGPIYDTDYWSDCESVISALPNNVSVNYKGVLASDKVPNVLSQYDYFVMLSEGENFGHAILEAFSAGLPVIISDQTPWRNLEAKHVGWDVAITSPNAASQAIDKAIGLSDYEYQNYSKSAYEFAQSVINDPEVLAQNKALFQV